MQVPSTGSRGGETHRTATTTQAVYGNHTVIKYNSQGVCKQQVLIMGLHNSGTSMVARLLTLLGMWMGDDSELSIGKTNKLKWCDIRQEDTRVFDKFRTTTSGPLL